MDDILWYLKLGGSKTFPFLHVLLGLNGLFDKVEIGRLCWGGGRGDAGVSEGGDAGVLVGGGGGGVGIEVEAFSEQTGLSALASWISSSVHGGRIIVSKPAFSFLHRSSGLTLSK